MIIRILRKLGKPETPEAIRDFALDGLEAILDYLKALVTLDGEVRALRSQSAEAAQPYVSAVVVATAITAMETLVPNVVVDTYTTALIMTDAGSGAGRWRIDGGLPVTAAAAASGLPLLAGGTSFTIVGQRNIREFRVIAEPLATIQLSVQLFK